MTGSFKYHSDILILISQVKFPDEVVFQASGLLDIIFKMTGSLKYKPGTLNFSSQHKFHEEGLFQHLEY